MSPVLIELVLPLTVFATAAIFTPGPNNIMLMSAGASFGVRPVVPHMLGIVVGFGVVLTLACAGLATLFTRYPQVHQVLKLLGATYLLYLAWRVATSVAVDSGRTSRPLRFVEAAGFQFANPKGVMVAVTVATTFMSVGGNAWIETAIIVGVFLAMTAASVLVWTAFGTAIGRLLRSRRSLRIFNLIMAAALVASVAFVLR